MKATRRAVSRFRHRLRCKAKQRPALFYSELSTALALLPHRLCLECEGSTMKKILKWTGIVVGSLVGLAAVAFVVLLIMGNARANKVYAIAAKAPPIPTDRESIQRGAHLVIINMCTDCH